jgi:hypothetical protein
MVFILVLYEQLVSEFTKYRTCYNNNTDADDICVVKCGTGDNDIIALAERSKSWDPEKDFAAATAGMGQLCQ